MKIWTWIKLVGAVLLFGLGVFVGLKKKEDFSIIVKSVKNGPNKKEDDDLMKRLDDYDKTFSK